MSSIVTSALVSLLLGCLLMWYIMTKLTQTKQIAQATSSTERNTPMEASSSTAPYYEDIIVTEERFETDVNPAYGESRQQD